MYRARNRASLKAKLFGLAFRLRHLFIGLSIGEKGEDWACLYLIKQGQIIREKNYRSKLGQIDLISEDNNFLIINEVKTRTFNKHFPITNSLGSFQKKRLRRSGTDFWIKNHLTFKQLRFDLILITVDKGKPEKIERITNAF